MIWDNAIMKRRVVKCIAFEKETLDAKNRSDNHSFHKSSLFSITTSTKIATTCAILSVLIKSTSLLPSSKQIRLPYNSFNPSNHEWSYWVLLSWRCNRRLQLLLDHTKFGFEWTEEDRMSFVFFFIRSCHSTPFRGWSSVIPSSSFSCVGSNTMEMISHNEVVFGNETGRLANGNISSFLMESTWYS